jgi:hypothetical protein
MHKIVALHRQQREEENGNCWMGREKYAAAHFALVLTSAFLYYAFIASCLLFPQ